nr:FtsX-like permease family protein [uncultured Ruminococcus sp.]
MMLFVTICTLSSAFSIRNSMNRDLREFCRADFQIHMTKVLDDGENVEFTYQNIEDVYAAAGEDLTEGFSETLHFAAYGDPSLTLEDSLGDHLEEIKAQFPYVRFTSKEMLVKVSDHNALCRLYGTNTVELDQDECIMICNFASMQNIRDTALTAGMPVTVFGNTLHSKYDKCQDGFIEIGAQASNMGIYIVPDAVVDENNRICDYFVGNYAADNEEQRYQAENDQRTRSKIVLNGWKEQHPDTELYCIVNTKYDIYDGTIGVGAMVTFLGLYIGLVFLIACGAILALKQLSESVDSIGRYEMLRKIGAEDRDISNSLFWQTGIFFLLPLLLAIIHSVFGMKFAGHILELIGTQRVSASIASTSVILLVIYGGYFLITYYCSKGIIKERK